MDWHPLDLEIPPVPERSWQEKNAIDHEERAKERAVVEADLVTYLELLSTKDLVEGIGQLRVHWCMWVKGDKYAHGFYNTGVNNLWDLVKGVLAKRPNIPNKTQAKETRRNKAMGKA